MTVLAIAATNSEALDVFAVADRLSERGGWYLDRQNDRKGFLESWFDSLPNWEFAARQYAASKGDGEPWLYPATRAPTEPEPV